MPHRRTDTALSLENAESRQWQQAHKPCARAVLGLDCEMCETATGSVVARVTLVDAALRTVYDALVAPDPANPITDYVTRYSGLRPKDLVDAPSFVTLLSDRRWSMHSRSSWLTAGSGCHGQLWARAAGTRARGVRTRT